MTAITLHCDAIALTDKQFFQLCLDNRDLRFERNAQGDLVIMPPTGGITGNRNIEIAYQLQAWSRQSRTGIAFDSSTCFKLPNGANRSPDAAWISLDRWNALTSKQQEKFPPLCPDFVVELRSPSDNLTQLQQKMQEYLENGMKLGWLIDRATEQITIYRQGQPVEMIDQPQQLSGEDLLPGFILNLDPIW
jgi:Uma2 family endonuclease